MAAAKATATVKATVVKKEKKATVKTTAKKTTKTAAKKTAAKKEDIKTTISVQYQDREWTAKTLIQTVKDIMKYDMQLDPKTIKNVDLYVNTEEDRVYFVVNGEINGSFAL